MKFNVCSAYLFTVLLLKYTIDSDQKLYIKNDRQYTTEDL